MRYRLLDEFRALFDGKRYVHRNANLGDHVARHLYEDLHAVGTSTHLVERIAQHTRVLNVANSRRGVKARRGDGTFGDPLPDVLAVVVPGFVVARGETATVEIGAEVKILAKAMIKQIDRVKSDLVGQVAQFKRGGGTPICVGIVGINRAQYTISYEGERIFRTGGWARAGSSTLRADADSCAGAWQGIQTPSRAQPLHRYPPGSWVAPRQTLRSARSHQASSRAHTPHLRRAQGIGSHTRLRPLRRAQPRGGRARGCLSY